MVGGDVECASNVADAVVVGVVKNGRIAMHPIACSSCLAVLKPEMLVSEIRKAMEISSDE